MPKKDYSILVIENLYCSEIEVMYKVTYSINPTCVFLIS